MSKMTFYLDRRLKFRSTLMFGLWRFGFCLLDVRLRHTPESALQKPLCNGYGRNLILLRTIAISAAERNSTFSLCT